MAVGTVRYYYYSTTDGLRPPVHAIELESGKPIHEVEKVVEDNFKQNRFTKIRHGDFQRDGLRATVRFFKQDGNKWSVSITLPGEI